MTLGGIEGRVALVTGAGSGIGEGIARALAGAGAVVAVTDLDEARAARVADSIGTDGGRAHPFAMDVRDADAVAATVSAIEDGIGPIDMLVNVAGVRAVAPITDMDPAEWDGIFAVNARGTFLCLQTVLRRMIPRHRGAVVTVGSQGSQVVRAERAAYGASKSAADYLTKCAGLEVAKYGIRCNVVHPGVTETPMSRANWDAGKGSERGHIDGDLSDFRVPIPLGRVGRPADTANIVLFLLSDRAAHITMAEIRVDGGSALIA